MDWQQVHRSQNMLAPNMVKSDGAKIALKFTLENFVQKNLRYINDM